MPSARLQAALKRWTILFRPAGLKAACKQLLSCARIASADEAKLAEAAGWV
jgi:hypothetical protein